MKEYDLRVDQRRAREKRVGSKILDLPERLPPGREKSIRKGDGPLMGIETERRG